MADTLIVITGGPGSGKSRLVDALAAAGLRTMPEAGRAIIQDQVAIGGTALPWADREAFANLMLGWELRSYHEALAAPGPVILDRGLPDVMGYRILSGLPVPDSVRKACDLFRYDKRVFIAPHWPAIFSQDAERKQSAEEGEATWRVMAETYETLGYELTPLPRSNVEDRVAFVLDNIG